MSKIALSKESYLNYGLNCFKQNYPQFAYRIDSWFASGLDEITVILDDGEKIAYDIKSERLYKIVNDDECTDEEFGKLLSDRIKHEMMSRQMTQKFLSQSTGIPQSSISEYINGRKIPSALVLKKIARALRCSVNELLWFRR